MASPRGPRPDRASLRLENLEDRTTPSYNPNLPLAQQVSAGMIEGDRLIVSMNDTNASGAPLQSTPYASAVKPLGWGIYSVRLTSGTDLGTALNYYAKLPGVAMAEPDAIVRALTVPNDPNYRSQYGPAQIGSQPVWAHTTGNPAFVVGVIDTGVDYTHPDLAANIWTNPGEIPGDGIDNDGNGYVDDVRGWNFVDDTPDPMDDNEHGTHVAGTIGAAGNNGVGVTGINWNVKIMALKFLDADGSGATSAAIAAINYSVMMGVKITNNSWGGGIDDFALRRAIAGARAAGQIFVAAAGNEYTDMDQLPSYPAYYSTGLDNVVTVAATDNYNRLASFSNYGATSATIAAPGVNILSTTPGGQYGYLSGTSMASPHVAGALALYWGANPNLTYSQVIDRMKATADPILQLQGKMVTGGRINVANMFGFSDVPPIVVGAPAGSEVVRVLGPGGVTQLALDPHPGFRGGVAAAAGDVTDDGVPDVVTAATFGGHVKVFDGVTGAEIRSFYAFEGYVGPISVSVGDLTGDGIGDIIVAANLNGHVKAFDGATGAPMFSALLYDGYRGAVAVSAADIDGDGFNELVTAANGRAGVHVKEFGATGLRGSFIATDPGEWPDFSLSASDLDLDGVAELLISQGPRVRVINSRTRAVKADFLAFDPLTNDPVKVEGGRYTGGANPQVVAVRETGGRAQVRVFSGPDYVLTDSFFADTR